MKDETKRIAPKSSQGTFSRTKILGSAIGLFVVLTIGCETNDNTAQLDSKVDRIYFSTVEATLESGVLHFKTREDLVAAQFENGSKQKGALEEFEFISYNASYDSYLERLDLAGELPDVLDSEIVKVLPDEDELWFERIVPTTTLGAIVSQHREVYVGDTLFVVNALETNGYVADQIITRIEPALTIVHRINTTNVIPGQISARSDCSGWMESFEIENGSCGDYKARTRIRDVAIFGKSLECITEALQEKRKTIGGCKFASTSSQTSLTHMGFLQGDVSLLGGGSTTVTYQFNQPTSSTSSSITSSQAVTIGVFLSINCDASFGTGCITAVGQTRCTI